MSQIEIGSVTATTHEDMNHPTCTYRGSGEKAGWMGSRRGTRGGVPCAAHLVWVRALRRIVVVVYVP